MMSLHWCMGHSRNLPVENRRSLASSSVHCGRRDLYVSHQSCHQAGAGVGGGEGARAGGVRTWCSVGRPECGSNTSEPIKSAS